MTLAATVTAIVAQLAAIVGSMFGRPTYRWMRAILLSIFAVVSSIATAILVV